MRASENSMSTIPEDNLVASTHRNSVLVTFLILLCMIFLHTYAIADIHVVHRNTCGEPDINYLYTCTSIGQTFFLRSRSLQEVHVLFFHPFICFTLCSSEAVSLEKVASCTADFTCIKFVCTCKVIYNKWEQDWARNRTSTHAAGQMEVSVIIHQA